MVSNTTLAARIAALVVVSCVVVVFGHTNRSNTIQLPSVESQALSPPERTGIPGPPDDMKTVPSSEVTEKQPKAPWSGPPLSSEEKETPLPSKKTGTQTSDVSGPPLSSEETGIQLTYKEIGSVLLSEDIAVRLPSEETGTQASEETLPPLASAETRNQLKRKETVTHQAPTKIMNQLKSEETVTHQESTETEHQIKSQETVTHQASAETGNRINSEETVTHQESTETEHQIRSQENVTHQASTETEHQLKSQETVTHQASAETGNQIKSEETVTHQASTETINQLKVTGTHKAVTAETVNQLKSKLTGIHDVASAEETGTQTSEEILNQLPNDGTWIQQYPHEIHMTTRQPSISDQIKKWTPSNRQRTMAHSGWLDVLVDYHSFQIKNIMFRMEELHSQWMLSNQRLLDARTRLSDTERELDMMRRRLHIAENKLALKMDVPDSMKANLTAWKDFLNYLATVIPASELRMQILETRLSAKRCETGWHIFHPHLQPSVHGETIETKRINFSKPFHTLPVALASYNYLDAEPSMKTFIGITDLSVEGFFLSVAQWADSYIYLANVTWIACSN